MGVVVILPFAYFELPFLTRKFSNFWEFENLPKKTCTLSHFTGQDAHSSLINTLWVQPWSKEMVYKMFPSIICKLILRTIKQTT